MTRRLNQQESRNQRVSSIKNISKILVDAFRGPVKIEISEHGSLRVDPEDLLKTPEAKRQLKALRLYF